MTGPRSTVFLKAYGRKEIDVAQTMNVLEHDATPPHKKKRILPLSSWIRLKACTRIL